MSNFTFDEDEIEYELDNMHPFPYPKSEKEIYPWKMLDSKTFYKGSWENKKPSGNGILINSEGSIKQGHFSNGELEGYG